MGELQHPLLLSRLEVKFESDVAPPASGLASAELALRLPQAELARTALSEADGKLTLGEAHLNLDPSTPAAEMEVEVWISEGANNRISVGAPSKERSSSVYGFASLGQSLNGQSAGRANDMVLYAPQSKSIETGRMSFSF